jgi:hypothetical protein
MTANLLYTASPKCILIRKSGLVVMLRLSEILNGSRCQNNFIKSAKLFSAIFHPKLFCPRFPTSYTESKNSPRLKNTWTKKHKVITNDIVKRNLIDRFAYIFLDSFLFFLLYFLFSFSFFLFFHISFQLLFTIIYLTSKTSRK